MMKLSLYAIALAFVFPAIFMAPIPCQGKSNKKSPVISVLLIDGQNVSHDQWKSWTPILLKQLDDADLFVVDVCTAPGAGESMKKFSPVFKDYDLVVTTYSGSPWPEKTKKNFRKFMAKGGGLVVVHSANNAFPEWPQYNEMTGLGGWEGRDEKCGSYLYYSDEGELIRDDSPGRSGSHGPQHQFAIQMRNSEHPIARGLPEVWMHENDELYDRLRGPAEHIEILATAYSSEEFDGSGRHEPVIMTISYKKGRIFHTTLGHSVEAMSCVGFMTTFVRGCEWAGTGKVTVPVSADFPSDKTTRSRQY